MSHVSPIEVEIRDLEVLKETCRQLGYEFLEGKTTYEWFGKYVGDAPLPEGFTQDDLGKCTHAIRVPGAKYEIGVVERDSAYVLLADFWVSGGIEKHVGRGGAKIKCAYSINRIKKEARKKRATYKETRMEGKTRIVITI